MSRRKKRRFRGRDPEVTWEAGGVGGRHLGEKESRSGLVRGRNGRKGGLGKKQSGDGLGED